MFCPNCNKQADSKSAFCPYCGAKLDIPKEPFRRPSKRKLLPWLVAAALVLGVVFWAIQPRVICSGYPLVSGDLKIDAASFPDEAFRTFVFEHMDTDRNGKLSKSEIDRVTKIYCCDQGIHSLEGIGYFPNLEELDCSGNHIGSLDLRNNPRLTGLSCCINDLTVLDISRNDQLKYIDCFANELTELPLGSKPNLKSMACFSNPFKNLDIRGCPLILAGIQDAFVAESWMNDERDYIKNGDYVLQIGRSMELITG